MCLSSHTAHIKKKPKKHDSSIFTFYGGGKREKERERMYMCTLLHVWWSEDNLGE